VSLTDAWVAGQMIAGAIRDLYEEQQRGDIAGASVREERRLELFRWKGLVEQRLLAELQSYVDSLDYTSEDASPLDTAS
jgi:hypothetical protein